MKAEMLIEHAITPAVHEKIQAMLGECFPGYPSRGYFKQLPHFRYLGWSGGQLVAHMAVDHRMIRRGDDPLRIFGIIDLCVVPAFRGRGYASRLIADLETLGRESGVDAVLLFADDPRLYLASGYSQVPQTVKWAMINEHESIGTAERLVDELMVKMLNSTKWDPGPVDLLGYLF